MPKCKAALLRREVFSEGFRRWRLQTKLVTGHARVEEEILPGLSLVGGADGACEGLQPSQNALYSVAFEATNVASTSFHFVVKNKTVWVLNRNVLRQPTRSN